MVAPKKAKLAEAEAEFAELMIGLNAKKAELAGVEQRLEALNSKLREMQVRRTCICDAGVECCERPPPQKKRKKGQKLLETEM